jgi:hypothetical protein
MELAKARPVWAQLMLQEHNGALERVAAIVSKVG